MSENLEALYTSLTKRPQFSGLKYDEFVQDMQDENNRRALHTSLQKIPNAPQTTFEEFTTDMGLGYGTSKPDNQPLSAQDKLRLGSFVTAPVKLQLADKPAGQFYTPTPVVPEARLYNPQQRQNDMAGMTAQETENARPAIQNEFTQNGQSLKQGHGTQAEATKQSTDYLNDPRQQAAAQFDLIRSNPAVYTGEDFNAIFDAMPEQKQYDEWQKDPEKWNDRPYIKQVKTLADDESGFWATGVGNTLQALNAGSAGVFGGLSEFVHQNIERPLYGWMWSKEPNSRMAFGRLADSFFEDQAYSSSAAGKHNTVENGQVRQKDFVDYIKEGDYARAFGDLGIGALESAPTSAVAIGATVAGAPQVGLGLIGAQVAGTRKRELDRNNPELSELQKTLIAYGSGAIEAGSEMLGDVPIGRMLAKMYTNGGKVVFDNVMKKSVNEIINSTAKNISSSSILWKAPLSEGLEEFASGIGNYSLDASFGLHGYDVTEMLTDASKQAAYGAVAGGGFGLVGAPGIMRNKRVAAELTRMKSSYDTANSMMKNAIEGSGFEFDGEKILTLPLEQQREILTAAYSSTNLTDAQKASIRNYVETGNRLQAALVNVGLTNIELLRKKAAAYKQVTESVNAQTGTIDRVNTPDGGTFIIKSGNVAQFEEDGTIDRESSDEAIYYYTGQTNEDGTPEVNILTPDEISTVERLDPQQQLQQQFAEIEAEEFSRSEFGAGMTVALNDGQGGTIDGTITAVTPTGFVVNVMGQETEVPFTVAPQTMEVVESGELKVESEKLRIEKRKNDELSNLSDYKDYINRKEEYDNYHKTSSYDGLVNNWIDQYKDDLLKIEDNDPNRYWYVEKIDLYEKEKEKFKQINEKYDAELKKLSEKRNTVEVPNQNPSASLVPLERGQSGENQAWTPGTQSADGVVMAGERDGDGNYLIYDNENNLIDRATPEEMVSVWGFETVNSEQSAVSSEQSTVSSEQTPPPSGTPLEKRGEAKPAYPTLKDGTPDFAKMTDGQIYEHTKETEGEEALNKLVARQLSRLQGQIQENTRATNKLKEETNKLLAKSKTPQQDRIIETQQAAKEKMLQEESISLANKLADLKAYLPKVEVAVTEVPAKAPNLRPEIAQLQKEESVNSQQSTVNSSGETLTPNLDSSETLTPAKAAPKRVTPFQKRQQNLGDYLDMEDYILRAIAGGQKFKWTSDGVRKGMADELGFGDKNAERLQRRNLIDESAMTPQEFAHELWNMYGADGNAGEIPGVRDMSDLDMLNLVNQVLLSTRSNAHALEQAEAKRKEYELNAEDYGVYTSFTPEEINYLEQIPDDILESYLGITNFTPEQIDYITNLQNEYGQSAVNSQQSAANKQNDAEPTNTGTSERDKGVESETATAEQPLATTVDSGKLTVESASSGNEVPEQTRPTIDFNNWKWEKVSTNAIVIRPNTVAKPFTDEQFNTIMEWGEKNNFTPIRNSRNTRIEFIVDKLDNALIDYLDSVSVKAINDKKAADEKAKKEEAEKAKKEELRNTVNSNPATSWINREFGEDAMNDYNKNALAKFLNGETKKFDGQVNNKWVDAISRLNALTEDGKGVDFDKLKKAYEQSEINTDTVADSGKLKVESAAERDTAELDAYIAEQAHNTNPTEKQKETGIYDKARVSLQGYNITIETLKGTERKGVDENGQPWSVTMNNHYGEFDGTTGYDGDPIDVFIGPNPKGGGIFVVDQVTPPPAGTPLEKRGELGEQRAENQESGQSFDESKVMLGFDSAEEAKAAYMSNYSEGWDGFGAITPAGENFKQWLYDGKKQRKPYAEYKDTPEAVDSGKLKVESASSGNEVPEQQKGFRFITEEEAKKVYHHTGEKALANDLYSKFDGVSRAQHRYEEYGLKKTISIQDREVEATLWYDGKNNDQPRISYQYTDNNGNVVKQTLLLSGKKVLNGGGFQFNKVTVKSEVISPKSEKPKYKNGNTVYYQGKEYVINGVYNGALAYDLYSADGKPVHEEIAESELSSEAPYNPQSILDVANEVVKTVESKQLKVESEQAVESSKLIAAQAEADAALAEFMAAFNDLNSDNLGIVDNTAEKQAKMLVAGTKMVGAFTKLGVYKFAELIKAIQAKGIQVSDDLLSAIKKSYGAFAAENDIDELDDMKTVRKFALSQEEVKSEEKEVKPEVKPTSDEQKGTTTAAIQTTLFEVESIESAARDAKTSKQAGGIIERCKATKQSIDSQIEALQLQLAAYETGDIDHEQPNVVVEKYIEKDVREYSKALAKKLGYEHDADKKGKPEYANGNIAPAGGTATFILWKPNTAYGVYVSISYDPDYKNGYDDYKATQILWRATSKSNKYIGFSNQYAEPGITVGEFSKLIEREVKKYDKSEELTPQLDNLPKSDVSLNDEKFVKEHIIFGSIPKTATTETLKPQSNEQERGNTETNSGMGSHQPQELTGLQRTGVDSSSPADNGVDGRRSGGLSDIPPTEGARNTRNNVIPRGKEYAPTSPKSRFDANIEAIKIVRRLMDSGKQATKADQQVLRQFSGWGGLGTYFNNKNSAENKTLREVLTPEEYESAVMSINSAYYTPAVINNALWDVAEKLGFTGGTILEGSAGIGNIIGSMPRSISSNSSIEAVEIDEISGNILKYLYPDAKVSIKGFEDTDIANGSVDLAITNVPFVTGLHVYDPIDKDLSKKFKNIHDFCIAKNIRKLKEGGIGIFITSNGTLDKSKELREWIGTTGKTDVIGAFRLNNDTFGGTNVTSDIIIVRKRVANQKHPKAIDILKSSFERSGEYDTKETEWNKKVGRWVAIKKQTNMEYNDYFKSHPENMGGEMAFAYEKGDTFRPGGVGLYPSASINQNKQLKQWLESFEITLSKQQSETAQTESESTTAKEGQLILNAQGKLSLSYRGTAKALDINDNKVKGETKAQCLKDYNTIKETLQAVLDYQVANESNDGLKPLLNAFNRAYDNFVAKYGQLNKNVTISFLRNDVDFPSIVSIEKYSETKSIDGKVTKNISKTAVFEGRVVAVKAELKPTNAHDAVIASIYKYGAINVPYIAESLNKTEQQVTDEIISSKLGFKDPASGSVVVRHEYLSGDVRAKLKLAQSSNAQSEYSNNIEELAKVIPLDIPAHLIEFTMGTSWLDKQLYVDYFKEKFGTSVTVQHNEGRWTVGTGNRNNETNRAAGVYSEMLGITVFGSDLATAAMNLKQVTISETRRDSTGKTETITDKDATQAANTRVSEIRDDFKDFVRAKLSENSELAEKMAQEYNERANSYVPMDIDDTYLPERFEGATEGVTLHAHQKKATIRGTMEPLMLAHEVGAGKTFVLISTAMEMRRLGTANKPMIVVQNATVGQFVTSAKQLYPNAKILTITENDRTPEGRRMFYAKIKYSDWDMIVVPQSTFEMIPDSPEMQQRFIEEKIDEKLHALEALKEEADESNKWTIQAMEKELDQLMAEMRGLAVPAKANKEAKQTAKTISNAAAKAKEQLDRRTDDVQYFDQMGIDALLVDEAHEYKRLGFATSMTRGVKGIDPAGSKKSAGVYLKTRVVLEKSDWKNVVFATGTPISNTAAEIWTFMKFLIPKETLIENEIYYFDDFVRNFGSINQSLEFATNGSYKENTRFSSYINKPELIRLWATVTDTVLSKDIDAVNEKIPLIEGDKATDIFLPQTPSLIDIMRAVKVRLKEFENMSGKEKRANSSIPIVMYGYAKRAAIDSRLISKIAEDEPNSKTNRAVEETLRSLKDSNKYKGTIAIFCDSQNRWDVDKETGKKIKGFDLFEDIKTKLIAKGVAESEIMIIKPGMTVARKEKIFDAVKSGEIRVVLGNTKTLGTGVNIQERLHTLIHMDAPDRPMDYTQRNGRILRQGNLHKEWGIPVRVLRFGVEDSLDVTSYQRLKTKAAFIDSIMDGKLALTDPTNPEGRILEEDEEGLFDNPVAVLSGSQYALLKNQAERELRKWESKKKQHESDQIYIQHKLKENAKYLGWKNHYLELMQGIKGQLEKHFSTGINTLSISGKNISGVDKYQTDDKVRAKVNEAIKPIAKAINERVEKERENAYFTKGKVTTTLKFNGIEAIITTEIERESKWDDKVRMSRVVMHKTQKVSLPEIGIEDLNGGQSLMSTIDTIYEAINVNKVNGRISTTLSDIQQLEADNAAMEARRGKPFEHNDTLQATRQKVSELTELMKEELEAKEEKYKNAGVGSVVDLGTIEIEDEVEDEAPQLHTGDTMQPASPEAVADTVQQLLKTGLAKQVRMVTPEEMGSILDGTEQKHAVYHGSPHSFDQFSLDHIGTGEGARAYGYGLYFTDKKTIAENYAEQNSRRYIKEMYESDEPMPEKAYAALEAVDFLGFDNEWQAANEFYRYPRKKVMSNWDITEEEYNAINNALLENKRNLYAVELHDGKQPEEYVYLRWDKPFREQSQTAKDAFSKGFSINSFDEDYETVGDFYKARTRTKSSKEVSEELLALGIDGIQYPANFTTGKANDTDFNYVVFDPSAITIKEKIQFMRTPTGTIYGFVKDGVVYLNSNTPNLNTPIHEFGHLWVDAIEGSELYERGKTLVMETPYWERVNADPNYNTLSENARVKEALAMAIGDKGETVKQNIGLFARIKVWINDVWKRIGSQFGIQNLTAEQIQNLTFEDFTEVAVSELMAGEKLTSPPTPLLNERGVRSATITIDGKERPTTNSTGKPIHPTEEGIRNFYKWFGDSKVVDAEGRPLVVYHGSPVGNISIFDRKEGSTNAIIHSGLKEFGLYFTTNPELAKIYMHNRKLNPDFVTDIKYQIELVRYKQENVRNSKDYYAYEDEIERLRKVLQGEAYPVYLKIDKLADFDAKNQDGYLGWKNLKVDVGYKTAVGIDAIEAIAGKNEAVWDKESVVKDGIWAKNIVDLHINTNDNEELQTAYKNYGGDVYLLFDGKPENIKSATGNNGGFDGNDADIRYQVIGENESEQAPQQPEYTPGTPIDQYAAEIAAYNQAIEAIEARKKALKKEHTDKSITNTEFVAEAKKLSAEKQDLETRKKRIEAGTSVPEDFEAPQYTGQSITELAAEVVSYNEQSEARKRLIEIAKLKRTLATMHRLKEMTNTEYVKQMTALHDEQQRLQAKAGTSDTDDTDPDDDPKPTHRAGQSPTQYATELSEWNYRQAIAKSMKAGTRNITGGMPAGQQPEADPLRMELLRTELDQRLGGFFGRLTEGWQDNIRSVRIFQDLLKDNGTRVSDFNNFYMQYTAIQGKNDAHLKDFGKRFMEAINHNVNGIEKFTNYSYRELENYVFMKHGIERNEYMRAQKALENVNKKLPKLTPEQIEGDIDGSLQDEYKATYDQMLEDETQAQAGKDYAGLYAIAAELYARAHGIKFNPAKHGEVEKIQALPEFENERDELVDEYIAQFEETINGAQIPGYKKGETLTIDGFWSAINEATHYTIDRLVTSGIESKDEMDDLKQRFKYYVPLRGHEVEAEKFWQYEAPDNKNMVSKPIVQARGRKTRAEHPFAYIIQQAQTTINKANRNTLNQTLLRLGRMDKSGLISVSEAWYLLTGIDADGKEIWEPAEPEFSEDHAIRADEIRAWNDKMIKLEEEGKAQRKRKGLNIGGIFIKPRQRTQHTISVFENGTLYQVYINGNPRVSQAVNELNGTIFHFPIVTPVTRFLSAMNTSRSPQFMLTNGARDLAFASTILPSKEGGAYTGRFLKNYPVAMAILANDSTFDFGSDKNIYKKYLKEFEMNGGETGYSHLLELQDIEKKLRKEQKNKNYLNPKTELDMLIDVIDGGNRVIENTTRLAVYIASRQEGRSIERSVSDSKEVTLNFNRRGSGIMGAAHVQSIFMFVNAGVQALANFGHVYKMHPAKMTITISTYAALGYMLPMLISMIGGDDKRKKYLNMSDWERQTNLCLPTDNGFVKLPLPQEMRVFHKLGDNMYSLFNGRTELAETTMETLKSAADMIPISPLGAMASGEIKDFADLIRIIAPDALRGFVEIGTNTNFTGGQIFDKYKDETAIPGYQKARVNRIGEARAPEPMVNFTRWLDNVTGGDGVKKGELSWNPDKVNHLARFSMGGLYSWVAEGAKSFTKRFYTSDADIEEKNSTLKDYYEAVRTSDELIRQAKVYTKQLEAGTIRPEEYAQKVNQAALSKARDIHAHDNTVSRLEKTLRSGTLGDNDEKYYKHMSDSIKEVVVKMK